MYLPMVSDILRKFNASEGVNLGLYIYFINDYIIVKHQVTKNESKMHGCIGEQSQ